jgi:tocopherol O-methyltransferase
MINKKNLEKISQYYTETRRDYHYLLRLPKHWGMHFGYYITGKEKRPEASLNLNRVLAQKAGVKSGDVVFDAGCGVGGSLIWLIKNKGATGTGMSITPSDIAKAKEISLAEGISDKAEFMIGDFRDTNLPASSFDIVWAIESICHAENKADFIKEAYRILKPGGRLAVSDGFLSSDSLTSGQKQEVQDWLDGWAVPNLASIGSFKKDLDTAGFKSIRFEDKTKNVMKFSKFLYLAGRTIAPIASRLLVALGKRTDVGAGNVVAAVGQYKTLKKGYWTYGMYTAVKPKP